MKKTTTMPNTKFNLKSHDSHLKFYPFIYYSSLPFFPFPPFLSLPFPQTSIGDFHFGLPSSRPLSPIPPSLSRQQHSRPLSSLHRTDNPNSLPIPFSLPFFYQNPRRRSPLSKPSRPHPPFPTSSPLTYQSLFTAQKRWEEPAQGGGCSFSLPFLLSTSTALPFLQ